MFPFSVVFTIYHSYVEYIGGGTSLKLPTKSPYWITSSVELSIGFENRLLKKLNSESSTETGAITEFYGHSGSGKTQICHTLCIMVQQLCPDNKSIYIDTEGKFRPERIAQIAQKKGIDADKSFRNVKSVRILNTSRLETVVSRIAVLN